MSEGEPPFIESARSYLLKGQPNRALGLLYRFSNQLEYGKRHQYAWYYTYWRLRAISLLLAVQNAEEADKCIKEAGGIGQDSETFFELYRDSIIGLDLSNQRPSRWTGLWKLHSWQRRANLIAWNLDRIQQLASAAGLDGSRFKAEAITNPKIQ